jgi:hypothetical protein
MQDLHSRATFDQRVLSKVDLSKTAFAELPNDAVVAKKLAGLQRHARA